MQNTDLLPSLNNSTSACISNKRMGRGGTIVIKEAKALFVDDIKRRSVLQGV